MRQEDWRSTDNSAQLGAIPTGPLVPNIPRPQHCERRWLLLRLFLLGEKEGERGKDKSQGDRRVPAG